MSLIFSTLVGYFLAFFLISLGNGSSGAKVLGLFPYTSESHFSVMKSLLGELSRRGHNVTVYTGHHLTEHYTNVQKFIIEPEYPFWKNLQKSAKVKGGLEDLSKLSEENLQKALATEGAANVEHFLSNPLVKALLATPSNAFDFDLILVDFFYSEALLTFGYIHKKPTIAFLNNNFENYMQRILEILVPSPCSHLDFLNHKTSLGFWEKRKASQECSSRKSLYENDLFKKQEKIVEKFFPPLPDRLESLQETLLSDVALYMINNHIPLSKPRPFLYNTIEAGGLHISRPRDLPWNVKRFLDEDRKGVIYINLGDEQLCADIPKSKIEVLYKAFNKVKVIWTCHDDGSIKDAPNSWLIQHMVPQSDILAHPHIKMFIMNGNLLSLQEGIVRHVPMLSLPIFKEEHSNTQMATNLGIGIHLEPSNFTEDSLKWAYKELSEKNSYAITIRKVSEEFRDRPLGGLETSMYWIDYVLRHSGGRTIKTPHTGIPSNSFKSLLSWLPLAIIGLFILWKSVAWILQKKRIEDLYKRR